MPYYRGAPYNAAWGIRQENYLPQSTIREMMRTQHRNGVDDRYANFAAHRWAEDGGWSHPANARAAYGGFQNQYMGMQSPWGPSRQGPPPRHPWQQRAYFGGYPSYGGFRY
ncbi:hypothetical protein CLAFUW4_00151 [Fulvia fulva]|uniref:Uncharacterized protein n=1 Tax=Passalora fulva TaxID=5499 RepID=A0A9Q8L5N7_PASFU|nr:uncharacterized protein CLAFUR5_00149 [Fulvia fulva]KAK4634602.1 hypothetical protein CLAFUR4_00151 [Fulvia fulva]KAK4636363.1 hypothetical protein CLAFUR0_00149 [Fulvia fulva]UJO11317.1 hypothetical protein CLAFUR5_00149 [Fulvia fulva]WPV10141.1 hypothetical protein CLAFUW4_00151 [Fulvia fulva]WPV24076.1 hypothetical protein CLAFUW7_00151 [Fulvia fulva]